MQTTYRSGDWYVIVLPGALVALPPDAPADVVTGMWERMPHQPALATVLDVLTSQAGGVLASLPPFAAVISQGGDVRVAVRGDAVVRVDTASGVREFSGAEASTWNERFVTDASRVEVTMDAAADGPDLPLGSGIVRAAELRVELVSADEVEPAVAPPAVEEPPTEEESTLVEPEPAPVVEESPEAEEPAADAEPVSAEPEPVPEPAESASEPVPVPAPVPELGAELEPEPGKAPAVDAPALPDPGEMTLAPPSEESDQLWGATVHSVPGVIVPPLPPVPPSSLAGDHDGETISAAQLRAVRQQSSGDENPTAVLPVATAATGRIRVSTGQVVSLDRTVVIGRRPRSPRASGANLPHLIAVDSPEQDISRSHLEIRPEGDTVVVIDLHTTNGSTLLRPGSDPVRLHPGEQTLVLSDDVVDLGDGIRVTFEGLP